MKHIKILLFAFLLLNALQMKSQQSFGGTGGTAIGGGGSSTYSIGQTFYKRSSSGLGSETQGVQQAFEIMLGVEENEISLKLALYPNPTNEILNLEFGEYDITNVKYQITDLNGKEITNPTIVSNLTVINIQSLPTSIYLLSITKNNKPVKIYKIIKN